MGFVRVRDLEVYKLAEEVADAMGRTAERRTNFARDTAGKQLLKAADGIGANIAAGSFRDSRRYGPIARGSFNGTQHRLRRAFSAERTHVGGGHHAEKAVPTRPETGCASGLARALTE
ncbi:four helix bundle protein [Gemmata sp. JC717]|uniref:four helix bundle protein n=1 Tax=Gemmata algarum TaxID=2975278 RepID=UPI0021BAE9B5|nr:four helix bundle protein [Gemmata algarum]MDY3554875.1 four helix bundle protein [Gemmata algarum]